MDRYIKESEIQEVIDKWQESLSPRTDLRDSVIFDTLESVNFHIDDLATAYVVEVVRCKDCIFNVANMEKDPLDTTDYSDITCSYFMTDGMTADDFCSYGKKVE